MVPPYTAPPSAKEQSDEIRDLLRAPDAAALARGRRGEAPQRRARAGRAGRQGRRSTTSGRSSTTSSRSTRTRARPRCSSPPPASAPRTSGWATASCRSRRASTIPRAWPSGSRRSTWSPAAGSSSAPASRARRPSWAGSASTARPSARSGRSRSTRSRACSSRSRSRATTASWISMPPRNVRAEAEAEAAPAAVGRVQPPRDDPAGRAARHRRAHVRVHRARAGARVGRRVLRPDRLGRVRAGRLRGQPELRRRAADDAATRTRQTAIERGIDGAHFFGYSLAHYYVFGDHRPGVTNVWDEFQAKRADYGFAREIINADDGPLGVKILQQGLGSLRGRDRHARAGRRPGPALRATRAWTR